MGTTGTLHLRAFFRNHATVRRVYIRTHNILLYRYIHRDDPQAPFRFIIILQNRTESYIIPIYYNNGRSIFFNFADSYQNTPFALTPQYLYIIIYIYRSYLYSRITQSSLHAFTTLFATVLLEKRQCDVIMYIYIYSRI